MENNDIIYKIRKMLNLANEKGIEIKKAPMEDGPIHYSEGEPKTEVQKEVAEEFERVCSEKEEALGMNRREFLTSPFSVSAAAIAVSTVLGFSIFPAQLHAENPDSVDGNICFGYPTVPLLDFASRAKVDVQDKVAVVIGGSKGIGRAAALDLQSRGFNVIGTSRFPHKYPEITEYPLLKLDISNPGSRTSFAKRLRNRLYSEGRDLNLLMLNAGRYFIGSLEKASMPLVRLELETNYIGHLKLFQLLEPLFPNGDDDYARVLLASSIAADIVYPLAFPPLLPPFVSSVYNASKSGMRMFGSSLIEEQEYNKILPVEGRRSNLKVSVVHPAAVKTGIVNDAIIAEDESDPLVVAALQSITGAVNAGVDPAIAGRAYAELAELEEPFPYTWIFDPAPVPGSPQDQGQQSILFILALTQNYTYRSGSSPLL